MRDESNFESANCPSVPSLPIKTDQGNLYFQKQSVFGHGIFVAAEGSVL